MFAQYKCNIIILLYLLKVDLEFIRGLKHATFPDNIQFINTFFFKSRETNLPINFLKQHYHSIFEGREFGNHSQPEFFCNKGFVRYLFALVCCGP